jgi:hypothetical protein
MFIDRIDWFEGSVAFKLTKQKFEKRKILEICDKRGKLKVFKFKEKIKVVHEFENCTNMVEANVKNLIIKDIMITWSDYDKKIKLFVNGGKIAEDSFFLKPSYIG